MVDYNMSPMRERTMRTNDEMNMRKKANQLRLNNMRPVSIVQSTSSLSAVSSSSSTLQDENDNQYQHEHKHQHEIENGANNLCNSHAPQRVGYVAKPQGTYKEELLSPATQMSFSYTGELQQKSSPSSMRLSKAPNNNLHRAPFRNRFFASAALVSSQDDHQQQYHQNSSKKRWENFSPPNSADVSWESIANRENSPGINVEAPTSLVVERNESQSQRQRQQSLSRDYVQHNDANDNNKKNNEDDDINYHESTYESFGNHSVVFSDLSGSEFSGTFSPTISKEQHGYGNVLSRNSRIQQGYLSTPQDALLEADDEQDEGGLELEEEKDQQMDLLYQRKRIDTAKGAGNRIQNGNTFAVDPKGKTQERGKNMSSRIALLFSNQNTLGNGDNNTQSSDRTIAVDKKAAELIKLAASPTRSNISATSSHYVGWPGTLDRHGSTLEISSNFSAGEKRISEKNDLENGDYLGITPSSQIENANCTPENEKKILDKKTGKSSARISPQNVSRYVAKMKSKYEGDVVDLDDDILSLDSSGIVNPADFHLAAVVADATSPSQCIREKTPTTEKSTFSERETGPTQTHSTPSKSTTVRARRRNVNFASTLRQHGSQNYSVTNTRETENEAGHSIKQDTPHIAREIGCQDSDTPYKSISMMDKETMKVSKGIDTRASLRRIKSARRDIYPVHQSVCSSSEKELAPLSHRQTIPEIQSPNCATLSENALKENDRLTPAHVSGGGFKGYRGFLDKTKGIPNLIDDDIDSVTTASTHATDNDAINRSVRQRSADEESDVFDGLPNIPGPSESDGRPVISGPSTHDTKSILCSTRFDRMPIQSPSAQKDGNRMRGQVPEDNVGRLGIQASPKAFRNTTSLSKFKTENRSIQKRKMNYSSEKELESLPEGEGNTYINDHDSVSSGSISEESWTCLSKHAIEASQVRKLVRKFRNMSKGLKKNGEDSSNEEDAKKAFALFELRSRVMETDIGRGLERTGGTVVVDDIVLTPYNQAAHRIRDAIIVSKAWRDGASPKDARTASLLMNSDAVHCIKRVVRPSCSSTSPQESLSNGSFCSSSTSSDRNYYQVYSWEKVLWIDDTEFSLLRCPSLGPRSMRGFEMFTIGDCQSILLKLTNERCEELREALNDAISRQLFAERSLEEERDVDDESDADSFMTDAETIYLQAMEDVKVIAKNLANAEKSFHMVRGKIEKLVMKYETLLEKIDNDEDSVISLKSNISTTDDDSCKTDEIDNHHTEREELKRRAQRAELKAEVAVREAEKLKQEAEKIKYEKQEELETLQKKLEELETKSAHMASEFELKLNNQKLWANSIGNGSTSSQASSPLSIDSTLVSATGAQSLLYAASHIGLDQEKINAKVRIKERFRQRNAQGFTKAKSAGAANGSGASKNKQKLSGQVHQRLEFYERSLQAVRK